ncbi:MAG: YicC family protein [Oscillospiraceae bacterium]|jgi:uncharacterized protein (TIGR00255 family)|nr:YicC family protein [Oscillospiraceae bacterium]
MVRSMTGYGRGEFALPDHRAICEIKSVNHRYFEFSARTPRGCAFLEEKLKAFFQPHISRGKVECCIQLEFLRDSELPVKLQPSLLGGYLDAFALLEREFGVQNDVTVSSLLRVPELFQVIKQAPDEETVWEVTRAAAQAALSGFLAMRETEGGRLRADILARAEEILAHVRFVEERSPQIVREYGEKLLLRMRELLEGASVEEQRLLAEAAIFADKTATAEETIRLRSHLAQLAQFFESAGPIGRKLDFLVQEINREANTVGSKAQDLETVRHVVEIKTLVEKIREQVQNIE